LTRKLNSPAALANVQKAVVGYFWNIIANVVTPVNRYEVLQRVQCQDIAAQSYQAESLVCNEMQTGYDAAFWALGCLGFFYALHVFAVKIGVTRLYEDPKWLIMAAILKQTQESTTITKSTENLNAGKTKVNATGTSYLNDDDFEVTFAGLSKSGNQTQSQPPQYSTQGYNGFMQPGAGFLGFGPPSPKK
jgi:hypothetical protein